MSLIVHKREFSEASHALIKAAVVSPWHLTNVFNTLAQVVSDLTGEDCELVMRVKDNGNQSGDGALGEKGAES
jgi:hypothetical protein